MSKTKEPVKFDSKVFEQWLKQFKGKGISPRFLDLVKRFVEEEKLQELTNDPKELTELIGYLDLLNEFNRNMGSYLRLINKLARNSLKEDPKLYQKFLSYDTTLQ